MLRRRYRFLYLPDDHAESRALSVPRYALGGAVLLLLVLLLLSVFYVLGLFQGSSWLPGGSRLQRENVRLTARLDRLGDRVAVLGDHLEQSYRYQEVVATAIGLDPLDPNVREAGVGGRTLDAAAVVRELPDEAVAGPTVGKELDALIRQARIQHEGYRALLDTLSAREQVLARIPSIRPVQAGWLSSSYGYRTDPFTGKKKMHKGLDFSVPQGTPVYATAAGRVVEVKRDRGLGKMVRLDHGNRMTTTYGHLSDWRVEKGDVVERGQMIALSGNTGRSTAPHLHYEVAVAGRHVNPRSYILDGYARR